LEEEEQEEQSIDVEEAAFSGFNVLMPDAALVSRAAFVCEVTGGQFAILCPCLTKCVLRS